MSNTSSSEEPPAKFQQSTYNALKKELTDTIKKIANYETRSLPQDPTIRNERVQQYCLHKGSNRTLQ